MFFVSDFVELVQVSFPDLVAVLVGDVSTEVRDRLCKLHDFVDGHGDGVGVDVVNVDVAEAEQLVIGRLVLERRLHDGAGQRRVRRRVKRRDRGVGFVAHDGAEAVGEDAAAAAGGRGRARRRVLDPVNVAKMLGSIACKERNTKLN